VIGADKVDYGNTKYNYLTKHIHNEVCRSYFKNDSITHIRDTFKKKTYGY